MDDSDLIRLSAEINALNVTLQQTKASQEHLAGSIDALRRAQNQDEARDDQSFGLWLFGTIFGGVLVGTLIGNMIGGAVGGTSATDRISASNETRRRNPP
jgi:predicted lipid-binding transport protein (Tim44 family)